MVGDHADQFEVSKPEHINEALDQLVQFIEDPPPGFTANKASQKYVDIKSPMGTETMYVPQNDDEVSLVKDSDEWMIADTKAVDVGLLAFGKKPQGATLVRQRA